MTRRNVEVDSKPPYSLHSGRLLPLSLRIDVIRVCFFHPGVGEDAIRLVSGRVRPLRPFRLLDPDKYSVQ